MQEEFHGKINAIATIGGIFGTFLAGFWLVPNIGSVYILYLLSIILILTIILVDLKLKDKFNIFVVIIVITSLIMMNFFMINNNNKFDKIMDSDFYGTVSIDTQYGRVLIYNSKVRGEDVRVLNIDGGYETITYTNENKIYDLVSSYTKMYNIMFEQEKDIKNVLMVGGAGYAYPKYYISHYEDKNMDVVEIDGKITEVAKKYFYLDRLIKDYNLEENKRLNLITEDGRTYLNNNTKKYDAILNDAFSGNCPAKVLTTSEAIEKIKNSLVDDGMYLTNIISSLEGENSKFIRAEVNTLKQHFKNVYVIPCSEDNFENKINSIVLATDVDLYLSNTYNMELDENEIILTDDFCPVETLVPQI